MKIAAANQMSKLMHSEEQCFANSKTHSQWKTSYSHAKTKYLSWRVASLYKWVRVGGNAKTQKCIQMKSAHTIRQSKDFKGIFRNKNTLQL